MQTKLLVSLISINIFQKKYYLPYKQQGLV